MTRPKISLMEAYMIETMRVNGITNEEIIVGVKAKDVSGWKQINEKFDFEQLIALAEKDLAAFEKVIHDGYAVKFVTVGGLERLLSLKFGKEAGKDYQKQQAGVIDLNLDEPALSELKQILSPNWKVEDGAEGISVLLKEQKDFS
ncbi:MULTISPECIES: hypothetical protein [Oceanobacillus]|uniref:Uncharacterized protein n=1 Tax=Oceanobacillus aidingensis TaxID=645964 RepID=A0ABV9K3L3_9BACI|nr:hypothetical protein [Oceanobacillus oncorhynchi]MDM8099676.1 hypothetical protein [Oceanobacillus oncorhynchi]